MIPQESPDFKINHYIAQKLNVRPEKISTWESGKAAIPVVFLMMLCVFLKVPVSYFYPAGLLWEVEQDMRDGARLKARLCEETRRLCIVMYHRQDLHETCL
jgi:transcriptional regulator with XRE-family HTH domain